MLLSALPFHLATVSAHDENTYPQNVAEANAVLISLSYINNSYRNSNNHNSTNAILAVLWQLLMAPHTVHLMTLFCFHATNFLQLMREKEESAVPISKELQYCKICRLRALLDPLQKPWHCPSQTLRPIISRLQLQ